METCGICHTDIHAAPGDRPVKPQPPFVPGHEGIGVVGEVGHGDAVRRPGDRVSIAWLGSACGRCRCCVSGHETPCEAQQKPGYSVDGGWAEYALADERFVPVPSIVSPSRRSADLPA